MTCTTKKMSPLNRSHAVMRKMIKQWQLYVFLLLPLTLVITFSYIPMSGILLAFKDFKPRAGILGSPWVGFKYFRIFFDSPNFGRLLNNTISLSLYSLLAGFPIPILLALALNEISISWLKRSIQTITYAPYFISSVVVVGIIIQLFNIRSGTFTVLMREMGFKPVDVLASPGCFSSLYVWSGIWQSMGYSAIVYIAALSNTDPSLYEAAILDGASRIQKIVHIDIPSILPTIVLLLILNLGSIMSVGGEKVLLLQNDLNLSTSEIISTYVYKIGIINGQFSLSTAIGLFNSMINFVLIVIVNAIARKVGETSLW